ncbi:hypothetical protein B0H14DRAFT_3127434 [Mycena olivaceomarginata]|nr:hypothetical protein B0H14DRAFT_3127434 [Mycena olivaceomarginata]
MDTNPVEAPPSFSSSRRRHGQHRSWVSAGGVSPRLPVASPYSRRARDPQSDYIRHRAPYDLQMGTSFDARALPTARPSVNLAAFPYVLLRTRVPADRGIIHSSWVRRGSIANAFPRTYFGYWRPVFLISTPTSAQPTFLVFGYPGLVCTPARTLVPFIRPHDDVGSMCPSWATLHYAILGVTFR